MTKSNKFGSTFAMSKLVRGVMGFFNSNSSQIEPESGPLDRHQVIEPSAEQIETLLSLFAGRRYPEVVSTAGKLSEQFPRHGFGWKMLGAGLIQSGFSSEALLPLQKATAMLPLDPGPHYNLCSAFRSLGQLDESAASGRRALQIKPDFAEGHNNLAYTLYQLGELDQAEVLYRRALEIKPECIEATWNLSILLLAKGRYSEAWPLHESRYDPRMNDLIVTAPNLPFPQWHGESLIGKSILLWPEQGFGDCIQFIRYAKLLKARGVVRITLFCSPAIRPLLETADGVDEVVTDIAQTASHDYWTFPASLPFYFGTTLDTIPDGFPYLHALPEKIEHWKKRLPAEGIKVGLVWKGNPTHNNDANRSLPGLSTLAPLWRVPEVTFVSLQKWQAEDEAQTAALDQPLIHLGTDIVDFADTAAIVKQLDLVICVDTAIAHLAGAIGIPCWTLLPACGVDWRWLRERSDTPWYPNTTRLFRQTVPGDWTETILEVTEALRHKNIGG